MKAQHRTWLAVPPDERDALRNAHPERVNGRPAVAWDKETRLWYARPGADLSLLGTWLPRPDDFSMDAGDPVTEFAQVLENAGLVLKGPPVMDGSLQRVPTKEDKKGARSGAYKAFLDGRPAGWYRDYRSSDKSPTTWTFSGGQNADPLARLHLRARAQQNRENAARELRRQHDRQAAYAARYVARWPQATDNHPYLARKGVRAAPGVRLNDRGELVIPLSSLTGELRSYQRIPVTGGKDARILKDSQKSGCGMVLGTPENGKPILFAEGYATAASLHEATGHPVVMTVDAGNLIDVGIKARERWPDSPLVFCADNDHALKNRQTGEPENKGILSAKSAAILSVGEYIVPDLTAEEKALGLTDFNDLDASRGRDAFRQMIVAQLNKSGIPPLPSPTPDERNDAPDNQKETAMENRHDAPAAPPEPPFVNDPHESEADWQAYSEYGSLDAPEFPNAEPPPAEPGIPEPLSAPEPEELPAAPGEDKPDLNDSADPVPPAEPAPAIPEPPATVNPEVQQPGKGETKRDATADAQAEPAAEADAEMPEPVAADEEQRPVSAVQPEPPAVPDAGERPPAPGDLNDSADPVPPAEPVPAIPEPPATVNPEVQQPGKGETKRDATADAQAEPAAEADAEMPEPVAAAEEQRPVSAVQPEPPVAPDAGAESEAPVPPAAATAPKAVPPEEATGESVPENGGSRSDASPAPDEPDGFVYAPRRPDARVPLDLDEIIKGLTWEERPDGMLYSVDGQPAFRDLGNRLEMADGASADDRKVLAALAVATKFYGGVIELTGSEEFKQNAMRLIVENNIEVRMKLPEQREQLEALRQKMSAGDNVVTHMPTGDLNRTTGSGPAPAEAPPVTPGAAPASPPTGPSAAAPRQAPDVTAPPVQPPATPPQAVTEPSPAQPVASEPPPPKLAPGQSVTAVLKNSGYAEYAPGSGNSFFVELSNRGGTQIYWGQELEELVKNCRQGEAVTLTLEKREKWYRPGEDKQRVRNHWSMTPVSAGIAVSHDRPEQGQQLQAYSGAAFSQVMQQISQGWPELTQEVRMPASVPDTLYLGEDRQPVKDPSSAADVRPAPAELPAQLTPVLASMDKSSQELNLLLVKGAGESLQGVARLNGTLYPVLATPTADGSQLTLNALTREGLRFAGIGQAVNREAESTARPAPQLMAFTLKGADEPVYGALYAPERQPDDLFRQLGFEQTWQQWSDSQKQEGRQEKHLQQDLSRSPGR